MSTGGESCSRRAPPCAPRHGPGLGYNPEFIALGSECAHVKPTDFIGESDSRPVTSRTSYAPICYNTPVVRLMNSHAADEDR